MSPIPPSIRWLRDSDHVVPGTLCAVWDRTRPRSRFGQLAEEPEPVYTRFWPQLL